MNAATWFVNHFPGLHRSKGEDRTQVSEPSKPSAEVVRLLVPAMNPRRSMKERMKASKKVSPEALSPKELVRLYEQLKAVNDLRISEVEAGRRAQVLARWYEQADEGARMDMWYLLSEEFGADMKKLRAAREQWESSTDTTSIAQAEMRLRKALESPRTRLLQRFAVFEGGVRFLVDMRAELLLHTSEHAALQLLDAELEAMFSTWFDVAFLELRRLSWDSPASLIEKLIKYEAVHDIKSWADLKNRLDSDRRCYGFFHPRLPDEPLIFVEVAFMSEVASSITPLLDEAAVATDLTKANTAIFYSISNTQKGLRGVSFGDSLIKRVVETIHQEFPRVKTFATLSPIPGLRKWLQANMDEVLAACMDSQGRELRKQLPDGIDAASVMAWLDRGCREGMNEAMNQFILCTAAMYLGRCAEGGQPRDPVARFHLGNGARVERLNLSADPSPKGGNQSFGLMVNYLYDLKRLETNRAQLGQGKIAISASIRQLLKSIHA